MKILHFIACIMLPISIINNGYTMETGDNNDGEQQQQEQENQQDPVYLRRQVVKFENGSNLCGLASLNQCLSALNPGDNEILSNFITEYNRLLNSKDNEGKCKCKYKCKCGCYHPSYILKNALYNSMNKNNKKVNEENYKNLLTTSGVDLAERYLNLVSISCELNSYLTNINTYIPLYLSTKNTLVDGIHESGIVVNNDTLNLLVDVSTMEIFKFFKEDIVNNESITINGNTFDLVSVGLFEVDEFGNPIMQENQTTGKYEPYSHYVSAKKLQNGKWILIDSSDPNFEYKNTTYMYDSFKDLVKDRVEKAKYDNNGHIINPRLLPRLLCYKKRISNVSNSININSNINSFNNDSYNTNNSTNNNYTNSNNNTYNNNYINQEKPNKHDFEKNDDFNLFNSQEEYKNYFKNNTDETTGNRNEYTTPKFGSLERNSKYSINEKDNYFSTFDSSKINIDNKIEELQDKKSNTQETSTQETSYDELIAKAIYKNKIRKKNLSKFVKFLEQLFNNNVFLNFILNKDTKSFRKNLNSNYKFLANKEFFKIVYKITLEKLN